MTEEKTDGEKEKTEVSTPATEGAGDGYIKETGNMVDRIDASIKRFEQLDKSIGEKVAYLQARDARDSIAGKSNAGVEKPKDEIEDKAAILSDEMLKTFQ